MRKGMVRFRRNFPILKPDDHKSWEELVQYTGRPIGMHVPNYQYTPSAVASLLQRDIRPTPDEIIKLLSAVNRSHGIYSETDSENDDPDVVDEANNIYKKVFMSDFYMQFNSDQLLKLPQSAIKYILDDIIKNVGTLDTEFEKRKYCNSELAEFVANKLLPKKVEEFMIRSYNLRLVYSKLENLHTKAHVHPPVLSLGDSQVRWRAESKVSALKVFF